MYLEKLKIQGFKSFAKKNKLVFPGMINETRRGITAIVGPNGSGKSNIADAVRWTLGEQSMKTLRGKKSEDVIFSGSDKKGKLGMAEVSMYLNNSSQANKKTDSNKTDISDCSEIVLTRRLFRNGDSDYLINNTRVRRSDVQIMLAKANFGQKTYSVIGQGMVEGFLSTSLAERKEFFDEATGVKQFQIKRNNSLNKLRASYENLNQVNMILVEIEPRLKSLTRQVNKLKKRDELKKELKKLQITYYGENWHEINNKYNQANQKFLEIEQNKNIKSNKLNQLNNELAKMENQTNDREVFDENQRMLNQLQSEKNNITKELAKINAKLEMDLEAQGRVDLSWLSNKKQEIQQEIKKIQEEKKSIQISQDTKNKETSLEQEKNKINQELEGLNNNLNKINLSIKTDQEINIEEELKKYLNSLIEIEQEEDVNKIKNIINKLKANIDQVIKKLQGEDIKNKIKNIQEQIIRLTGEKQEIIYQINEINLANKTQAERIRFLNEKKYSLEQELTSAEKKLNLSSGLNNTEVVEQKNELLKKIAITEEKIGEAEKKVQELNISRQDERKRLFDLQKNIQILQNEINQINNNLNDLKVNSTRHETKLEDLEIEIRQNLGSLEEIKNYKINLEEDYQVGRSREKINSLKHQLELIGGIDPEIEKEYTETLQRFDFLFKQVNDSQKAIKSLEEIIKELDINIKEKFDKEFKVISVKFQEYFKILFDGGNAKILKVTDEEESEKNPEKKEESEEKSSVHSKDFIDINKIKFLKKHNATGLAGIEIQATPPGKKIQSISMLSGGERALTAIAMICAIISANPSPFVVLDEVDAALDESNSERLSKILDDLSHKTQFIVVTHNRATMRRANVLYGVTMGDDGISNLLSVKLEDVKTAKN